MQVVSDIVEVRNDVKVTPLDEEDGEMELVAEFVKLVVKLFVAVMVVVADAEVESKDVGEANVTELVAELITEFVAELITELVPEEIGDIVIREVLETVVDTD